jgi:hypothetical protein
MADSSPSSPRLGRFVETSVGGEVVRATGAITSGGTLAVMLAGAGVGAIGVAFTVAVVTAIGSVSPVLSLCIALTPRLLLTFSASALPFSLPLSLFSVLAS